MRYRAFMIILYPDDPSYTNVMSYITSTFDQFAYIDHDLDYNDRGELKKLHTHVVIRCANPRTITGLAKELNIKENYIEPTIKNYIYALRYLIHADDKQKTQYEIENVIGTLKQTLIESLNKDKTESDYILEIMEIIENLDYIYITDFVKLIANSGLWSYYRRNAYTFNQVISEHNHFYLKDKQNKKFT